MLERWGKCIILFFFFGGGFWQEVFLSWFLFFFVLFWFYFFGFGFVAGGGVQRLVFGSELLTFNNAFRGFAIFDRVSSGFCRFLLRFCFV